MAHETLTPAAFASLPARGAWIETGLLASIIIDHVGRSPRGGRGLKPVCERHRLACAASLPARGAWIETMIGASLRSGAAKSLPARGAWIETSLVLGLAREGVRRSPRGGRGLKLDSRPGRRRVSGSLPARGAWIETRRSRRSISMRVSVHRDHPDRSIVTTRIGPS